MIGDRSSAGEGTVGMEVAKRQPELQCQRE